MRTFHIQDFGASVCDKLQTKQIQSALDACFLAGGGKVVIPCGIFRTGGLRLRSNTTLYLESGAVLKGSSDPDDYNAFWEDTLEPVRNEDDGVKGRSSIATSRWSNGLIRVLDAQNVAIVGEKGSYIDGVNCYDPTGEENYRGPHPISVWRCDGLYLDGYTITDGGNWGHAIFDSQNITAKNLTVYGGHDGFDVRTCDNVLIEDCVFNTGDDCIAGFDNHDVVVRNCKMQSSCSIFRFGGNNVLIENCESVAPGFGFRGNLSKEKKSASMLTDETCRHISHTPFLYYCDFRAQIRKTPGDILVRNCNFAGVRQLFRLEFDGEHKWCCNRSLRSITFENCDFVELNKEGVLHGDAEEKVCYTLKNCRISKEPGTPDFPLLNCVNFETVRFENVEVTGFDDPFLNVFTEGTVDLENSTPIRIQAVQAE